MRPLLALAPFVFAFAACDAPAPEARAAASESPAAVPAPAPAADPVRSVVRVNSTSQGWSPAQPWEKDSPARRRSLGAVVEGGRILTTAEMVADASFLELESVDGRLRSPGKVFAVDYEANLALVEPTDAAFLAESAPLELAEPAVPGETLEILQVADNGTPLVTTGVIQSIDVVSNFLPQHYFLTYEVKASMQSAASSYSLPALRNGKLAGILVAYNAKDQLSDILATEIVGRFLADAADGDYDGFPMLGISAIATDDAHFRRFLHIEDQEGGLYVATIRPDSAAAKAGLAKGDVILSIDGHAVDRLGYYEDSTYGRLHWSHVVRGAKSSGEPLTLSILRDGEPMEITAQLERRDLSEDLVPSYLFDQAPNFLVKGGLVFQELTIPLLEAFGDEWRSRAPLNLLDVVENPEKYEERYDRVVFLAGVIATPATVGYEPLRNLIVTQVNSEPVRDMKSLIAAFDEVPANGLHAIEFDEENFTVYLDELTSTAVDEQLLQRGLTRLSRAE